MKIFGRRGRSEPTGVPFAAGQSAPLEATGPSELTLRAGALPKANESEQATSRPTAPEHCGTVLSAGSSWRGKLKVEGSVLIEGALAGQLQAEHTVQIAESARVDATIRAEFVVIAGTFKGQVNSNHLELLSTARTKGDFTTVALIIGEGALVDGKMHMTESKPKARRPTRTAKKDQG